ncbi:MAG TPA: GNAT family N-acetyltransferase [Candidatus Stackebrandtia faecavium]|nr:GNAT family N-acetyltransferase [Candidatus Stackebrandtia faecavium]
MNTQYTVRSVGHDEVNLVASLIAESFQRLDVAEWLIADPAQRFVPMRDQFAIMVEHAVDHGTVLLNGDSTGAIVCFDNTKEAPEPADYDARLRDACGPHLARFQALDEAFAKHHPTKPHIHAAFLGVHRDHRDKGIGSALMRHQLSHADAAQSAIYLEASDATNRERYRRYGFSDLDPMELPDGPTMYPMWRDPAAA